MFSLSTCAQVKTEMRKRKKPPTAAAVGATLPEELSGAERFVSIGSCMAVHSALLAFLFEHQLLIWRR